MTNEETRMMPSASDEKTRVAEQAGQETVAQPVQPTAAKESKSGAGTTAAAAGLAGLAGAGVGAAATAYFTQANEEDEAATEDKTADKDVKTEEKTAENTHDDKNDDHSYNVNVNNGPEHDQPAPPAPGQRPEDLHQAYADPHSQYNPDYNNDATHNPGTYQNTSAEADVQVLYAGQGPEINGQATDAVVITDGNTTGVLVDVDRDGIADVLVADANGDGQISEDEMVDIQDHGVMMQPFAQQYVEEQDPDYVSAVVTPDDVDPNLVEVSREYRPEDVFGAPQNEDIPEDVYVAPQNEDIPEDVYGLPQNEDIPEDVYGAPQNEDFPKEIYVAPQNEDIPEDVYGAPQNEDFPEDMYFEPQNEDIPEDYIAPDENIDDSVTYDI